MKRFAFKMAVVSLAFVAIAKADPTLEPASDPSEVSAWNPIFFECPRAAQEPVTRHLGKVKGPTGHKSYFSVDCKTPPSYQCRTNKYVIAGDTVLLGNVRNAEVCATYATDKKLTEGWLPSSAVEENSTPTPAPRDWIGRWRSSAAVVLIEQSEPTGSFVLKVYPLDEQSAVDSEFDAGNAKGTPNGTYLEVSSMKQDGCDGAMDLLGPFLVVYELRCAGELRDTYLTAIYRKDGK